MFERPKKLLSVFHYHQKSGFHPKAIPLWPRAEIVEVVTKGRGWVVNDGDWVEVTPGTILWHVEGDETIGKSDLEEPYSCFAVRMEEGSTVRHVPRISFWHDLSELVGFAEEAIRMFLDEGFDRACLLDYLYSKLRYQTKVFLHRRENAIVDEPLRVARSIIETRYAERLRVEDLARAAGWSVPHLHDRFKSVYGVSPRQMILSRRLRSAREQLVGTGRSIKEIAAATGFTHSSAFCSAFRRSVGKTPKAYRDTYYFG